MHQINPKLNKQIWTDTDNARLFLLQKNLKSHWKRIAENFEGRTDNSIKNQFFSVVRKALRKICKVLGKVSNTIVVNQIKPKVLSEYLTLDLDVELGEGKGIVKVNLSDFIQKFAFTKYQELASKLTADDITVIQKCLDHLTELNQSYVKKKKIKKRIVKVSKQEPIKRKNDGVSDRLRNNELSFDNSSLNADKQHSNLKIKLPFETSPQNKNIYEVTKQFEELFKSNVNISTLSPNKSEESRKRLISFFDNLGNISLKMKNVLTKTSTDDLDPLKLSNIFSVTSKTKNFFNTDGELAINRNNNSYLIDPNVHFNRLTDPSYRKMMSPVRPDLKTLQDIFVQPDNILTHQIDKYEMSIIPPDNRRHMDQFNKIFNNLEDSNKNIGNQSGIGNGSETNSNRLFNSRFMNDLNKSNPMSLIRKPRLNSLNDSANTNNRNMMLSKFFKSRTDQISDDEGSRKLD